MSTVPTPVDEIRLAGGTRITGPSALTADWRRTVHLAWTLAYLEFRLKFFGSILGAFWQLGRPLMLFGVYYVVFTQFVDLNPDVKYYAPMLLTGIMLYQFFGEATSASVRSVVDRENLVRKIHFPRVVIPLAVVLTACLNLTLNLSAVGVFILISGVPFQWSWFEMIPVLAMLVTLSLGLAMLLSALFVRYRDIAPIWEVVTMAAFYATPILYTLETIRIDWVRDVIMFNPLAVVMQQTRHAVFDPSVPSAAEAIGGWGLMLVPLGITVGLFVLGFRVFTRSAPDVAEDL